MRIAIDVSQAIYGTGVSVYTKHLITNLKKIDSYNDYVFFGGSLRRMDELSRFANMPFRYPPSLADFVWNRLHTFPIEKLLGDVDILHTSDWAEPPTVKAVKVTTIHDLYPIKFPDQIDRKILEVHRRKLYWTLKESKFIIVPSLSTKNDLMSLGVNENRIKVIPEAPNLSRASEDSVRGAKVKFNIKGEYVMAIGATKLKNTQRIIKAFHLARGGRDLKLLIVGRPVGISLNEERNLRILGHVGDSDLSALLTGSSGLLFPSLYEGFGLPILDAFNCGVPVLTSDKASLPEVSGDGAIVVDPLDESSIAEGIVKMIRGPKGWIERGYEQVKKFSWEKTAQMTLDVYNEAVL